MSDSQITHEQDHPLYTTDRDHIDRMLAKQLPEERDLVDLARLLIRYEGFPGALDLQSDMQKLLNLWGLSRETLNVKAKELWARGFSCRESGGGSVGSGFDASESEAI